MFLATAKILPFFVIHAPNGPPYGPVRLSIFFRASLIARSIGFCLFVGMALIYIEC